MSSGLHQIVHETIAPILNRNEILEAAMDRGLGEGMQIEKWMLIEIIPELKKLRDKGHLEKIEGEHKYPIKKTDRYEHCDLWWKTDDSEYWLEVKTIVLARDEQKGTIEDIMVDLEKKNRLTPGMIFCHLAIVFPVDDEDKNAWTQKITETYTKHGQEIVDVWREGKDPDLLFVLSKQYIG